MKKYTIAQTKKDKKVGKVSKFIIFLLTLGLIATAWFLLKNKDHSSLNPISIVSNAASVDLKEADGRTNILILGTDTRDSGVQTEMLTDTIMVASIGKLDKDVVLISIPRDLWVQTSTGYSMKINALYSYGGYKNNNGEFDPASGIAETERAVSQVLGIPIHYHVLVNFKLFTDSINLLGGITVNVDSAFKDYAYPIEGRENDKCGRSDDEIKKMTDDGKDDLTIYPCRFETLDFKVGPQQMDGATALKFARSRHGNNNEGTDFARAKRQQKVIMAVKDKALSLQTLINPQKLKDLYDLYSKNVQTNIDLATLQNFYLLSQQVNFSKVESVVLDDNSDASQGGLLYAPQDTTLYAGAYVLIPRTGDYSQIHAYVQKYLFGTN